MENQDRYGAMLSLLEASNNMDTLLEAYRKVEAKYKEVKAIADELTSVSDRIETMMNDLLISRGEEGAVTTHGKVQRKISEQYYAVDNVAFRDWAIANNMPELVNTSLAVRAFNAYITKVQIDKQTVGDESPLELPPGVGVKQTFKLSITK